MNLLGGVILFLFLPTLMFADISVHDATALQNAIISNNEADDPETILFSTNIEYAQEFRPLNCNNSFVYVGRTYTIDGQNFTLSKTTPGTNYRAFFIGGNPVGGTPGGIITIQNLTIEDAVAKGGNGGGDGGGGGAGLGGGLFIADGSEVVLLNVHFQRCGAIGGSANSGVGGGGGGLFGNGGAIGNGGGGGIGGGGGGAGGPLFGGSGGGGVATAGHSGGLGPGGSGGADFNGASAGPAGNGASGQGGGGGPTDGGSGGFGGGGGGTNQAGGNGGDGGFGGGGGTGEINSAGSGGFGGGGGAANMNGGQGGFGGGGGTANMNGGQGGFGGGDGLSDSAGGGGGGAMGGAIFIQLGGLLTIKDGVQFIDCFTTAGGGPSPGSAFGNDIFMMSGTQLICDLNNTLTIHGIQSDQGAGGGSTSTGGLTKIGSGTLILNGTENNYTGSTIVQEGKLSINGSIASPTTVQAGATLEVFGTIHGTVNVEGTITSSDTFNIDGELLLGPDSITNISVDDTGHASSINVTGAASLAGNLNIIPQPGTYSEPITYTILQTTDGVNGTFIPPEHPQFIFNVLYLPTSVQLLLSSNLAVIPTSNLTGNQLNVAKYLNTLTENPTFASYIAQLSSLPPAQLSSALNAISPSRLAATTFISANLYCQYVQLISNRISQNRFNHFQNYAAKKRPSLTALFSEDGSLLASRSHICNRMKTDKKESFSLWADAFGQFSRQNGQNQNPAFDATSAGMFLALERFWLNGYLGAGTGYARSNVSQDAHSHLNYYIGSVYGTFYIDYFFFELSFSASYDQYRNKRKISFPDFNATAKSRHDGYQVAPHSAIGYDFVFSWGDLEPFASIDFVYLYEGSFSEKKAAPFNMHVNSRNASMWRMEAGFNAYEAIKKNSWLILFKETASYVNKQPTRIGKMENFIVGAPGSFTVNSLTKTQNLFRCGFELFLREKNGFFTSVTYDIEVAKSYLSNEIQGSIGIYF